VSAWHRGQPLTLLINVNARQGRAALEQATTLLRARGVAVEPVATTDQAHADAALAAEVRRGASAVLVGGGDGTLSHAAAALIGSSVALGVLPLGTGNTFARSVGVPLNLWDATSVIAAGRRARVDVGQVSMDGAADQVFLNSVGLGFSAEIARQLSGPLKRRLGLLAWPLLGTRALLGHQPLDLDLRLGAQPVRRIRSHQVLVANGRYVAGPMKAAPDAAVDDHRLDVLTFGGVSLLSATAATLRWATGRGEAPEPARALSLRSRRGPLWISVDGEVSRRTHLKLSVQPGALWVMVPEGFDGGEV
jgi:diacylglycerol kinase (ATP)